MKRIILPGILLCNSCLVMAQFNAVGVAQPNPEDSLRTVVMQEVQVTAKQKTQQQNLHNFFSGNKPATTEDILARLPELSLIRRGSYGMEPVIRSYNSGQVNLLLDGMRIHGACTDKMDPATIYIEPLNLQSIEVKTNGSHLLNGSSIGGSINLKLATASCHDNNEFSGAVSTGYCSVANAFYESLQLNYTTPKFGVRATCTYRKNNNYIDGSGKTVSFSQYEKANYSINGKYKLGQHSFIKADYLADDGWNIGYAALPMDVGYASARIASVGIVRENSNAKWQKLEAKLYANAVKHYMDDTKRPNVAMHMDMPGESFTKGFYAEGTRTIDNKSRLTIRGDVSSTFLKASMTMYQNGQPPMYMLTWPDNKQWQSGVAANYSRRLDSSLQLQLTARADFFNMRVTDSMGKDQLEVFGYNNTDRNFFLPAASVQLTKRLTTKLSASLAASIDSRTPTASELYGFYLFNQFDGYDYIGNVNLKPERSQKAEVTLAWHSAKLKLQATGYISRITNYILGEYAPDLQVMTIGAKGVKVYQSIPHAMLAGSEVSAIVRPMKQMLIISTLKYAYAKDASNKPLPMTAPLRNITSVRQEWKKFWAATEFEAAAAQNRVSTEAAENPTGAFSLWHVRAGYKIQGCAINWEINAGVENILNSYYREHLDWGNVARPGRNFFIQLTAAF